MGSSAISCRAKEALRDDPRGNTRANTPRCCENLEVPEVLALFNSVEKMASARNPAKKHSSSSSSTTSTEGQNRGAAIAMNTFANDGSFLELFKKRMEAESQILQPKTESTVEQTVDREEKAGKEVDEGSCQEKLSEGKVPGPSVSLPQQVWLSEERILGFYHFGRTSEPVYCKKNY